MIFPVKKKDDKKRLHPKTLVYTLESDGVAKVYPEDYILEKRLLNDIVGKTPIVIAVDQSEGIIALESTIDNKVLTFTNMNTGLIDDQTNCKSCIG